MRTRTSDLRSKVLFERIRTPPMLMSPARPAVDCPPDRLSTRAVKETRGYFRGIPHRGDVGRDWFSTRLLPGEPLKLYFRCELALQRVLRVGNSVPLDGPSDQVHLHELRKRWRAAEALDPPRRQWGKNRGGRTGVPQKRIPLVSIAPLLAPPSFPSAKVSPVSGGLGSRGNDRH